jgi:hypothetical protein
VFWDVYSSYNSYSMFNRGTSQKFASLVLDFSSYIVNNFNSLE